MTIKVLEFKREDWRDRPRPCARLPMTSTRASILNAP